MPAFLGTIDGSAGAAPTTYTGPVNAWTRFRSHRDLAVEGVTCLDLDFLARRHLDDRRDALAPAVVSHKLDDERSVWRPS